MPPAPPEAIAPFGASSYKQQKQKSAPLSQDDRHGHGDDDAARLPTYCRYRDLVEAGLTTNWPQLLRMIDCEGFPTGIWLSANIRVWEVAAVRRWLMNRPTARKSVPGSTPSRQQLETAT